MGTSKEKEGESRVQKYQRFTLSCTWQKIPTAWNVS